MNQQDKERLQARIPDGWWRGIDIGPGWDKIVLDLDADLSEMDPDYTIHQVKEKFGGLRYYTAHKSKQDPELMARWQARIMQAENESFKTCEECGEPGVLRDSGWIKTRCDEHSNGDPPLENWFS